MIDREPSYFELKQPTKKDVERDKRMSEVNRYVAIGSNDKYTTLGEALNSEESSHYAYTVAKKFPQLRAQLIDRVIDSELAYLWALEIGNQEVMIDRVIDSVWAYLWTRHIGNQDVMIDRVVDSQWAYYWSRDIGNRDIMKSRITRPYWIEKFNKL